MNILDLKRKALGYMAMEGTAATAGGGVTVATRKFVPASTPGAQPVYGGRYGDLLGYEVPQSYIDAQALAAKTAANQAAGPTAPGQVWYDPTTVPNGNRNSVSANAAPTAGFYGDPSLQNSNGFLSQVMQGVGDALPTLVPLAIAAGTGYGLMGAGGVGAAGAASAAPGTAVIDAAGNMIGGDLAAGVATSAPVTQGALGGWQSLGAGALGGATAGATEPAAATIAGTAPATATPVAATAGPIGSEAGATYNPVGTGAPAAAGLLGGTTVADSLIPGISNGSLLTTGLNTIGGLIQGQAATGAAQTQADAQIRAAQIAADAAKFKPVGVTTGFGSSQFGFDANGNLNSAGYNLTPEMKAQRDALIGQSTGLLAQAGGAQAATAPMGQAAQTMMGLGQGYLGSTPQEQAQKYLNDQLGLLSPQRASDMAKLQAEMQAQGRGGFAIGGGVNGQGAANPQLQALYNAQMQQNNQLAANATQGGMDYATFGANMVGNGGNLLSSMYGVQNNAYTPYTTALTGANTVEGLGQNAMTMGANLGNTATAASAAAGRLQGQGITNAANTMAPANAYSPWANILGGAGNLFSQYKFGQ